MIAGCIARAQTFLSQHIVSAPELGYNRITFASAAILQLRLAKLDEEVFRMPSYGASPAGTDTSGTGRRFPGALYCQLSR